VLLWPTPIVPAGFPPITVMPVPVKAAEAIVTVPSPVLVTDKLCVAALPTATLPKLTLVALGERMPAPESEGCVFAELVYPAQLESPAIARIMASVVIRTTGVDERPTVTPFCELDFVVRTVRSWLWALMSRSV
jgi:hypothetical protein